MQRLCVFIACAFIGVAVAGGIQEYWFLIFPSDANMTAHFERNEKSFDHLVERFRQDSELRTVSLSREVRGEREAEVKMPPNPVSNRAMNTIKTGTIRRESDTPDLRVSFIFTMSDPSRPSWGLQKTKGYFYSEIPPSRLVDSTDEIEDAAQHETLVYKQIAPNWYIYLDLSEIKCRS